MNLVEVKNMILDLISKHSKDFPTQNWDIRYSNRQTRALATTRQWVRRFLGVNQGVYRIEFVFNNKFINANLNNKESIKRVVLHEIAHAVVGHEHGHDRVWVSCCRAIGGDGKRLAKRNVDFIEW